MASYEQQYDPQSYVTTPYQLPIQQIMQAVQTRNQYWDSAASNLRNAYQNYLGLDLTRADNHQRLNGLMEGVTENLKQVGKTDLSLGENYGAAMGIFDPITKDDNIMGDNAITKHYKQELSTAQSYRTKDNGKEYSDTNVKDLTNHLEDFAKDPNASNWRQHYATRSYYTPYTDVGAEVRQVEKDFKPDVKSMTTPMYVDENGQPYTKDSKGKAIQSGYMLNETDKSIIASQYRAFMDAHLSDKAKNQLAIDGRVRYHDNVGALAQDYSSYNQDKINTYKNEVERIKGTVAGSNGTPAQKEAASQQINNYEAQVKELNLQNTKMAAGDYSTINPMKDQLAAHLYTNNYIDYLSKASAQRNIDIKYTPDQVWKTMFQEDNENKRFNIAKDTQLEIARMRNETQLTIHGMRFGLNGLTGIPGYGVSDDTHNESFGSDELAKLQKTSTDEFGKATDQLYKVIKNDTGVDLRDSKVTQAQRDSTLSTYLDKNKNSYDVKQYNAAAQKKNVDDASYKAINDWVDNQIKTNNPDIYNARQSVINNVKEGQPITFTDVATKQKINLNLSASDIQKILSGTHPDMSIGKRTEFSSPGYMNSGVPSDVNVINYKGRTYDFSGGVLGKALYDMQNRAVDFGSKRSDLLNQQINRISGIENLFENDKNPYYNAVHQIVERAVGGTKSVIKPTDIMLTNKDSQGGVYFKVQGDQNISQKDIKNKVEAAGGRYVDAEDKYYLPGRHFGQLTQSNQFSDSRLQSVQRLVDFRSTASPNDVLNTPALTFGNRNFQFKVDIQDGHPSYRIIDPYSGAKFGSTTDGIPYNTLQDAATRAQMLGNLSTDAYLNLVKTIGGVPDYQPK